jgi:hypothetical protein
VVGEGAAPSRHANLAFTGAYKAPLHGWCYPPFCRVLSKDRVSYHSSYSKWEILSNGRLRFRLMAGAGEDGEAGILWKAGIGEREFAEKKDRAAGGFDTARVKAIGAEADAIFFWRIG